MLQRIFALTFLLTTVILTCSRDTSPLQPTPSDFTVVNIIADLEKFDRTTVEKDAFHIDSVYVSGDQLHLFVSYGGGCQKHQFALFSTNGIYLSMPPQGDVFLGHDGNGDMCEAYLTEELVFDLTPLLAHNPGGMGLRIHQFQAVEPFQTIWWRTD